MCKLSAQLIEWLLTQCENCQYLQRPASGGTQLKSLPMPRKYFDIPHLSNIYMVKFICICTKYSSFFLSHCRYSINTQLSIKGMTFSSVQNLLPNANLCIQYQYPSAMSQNKIYSECVDLFRQISKISHLTKYMTFIEIHFIP